MDITKIKDTLANHGYDFIQYIGEGSFSKVLLCKSTKYNNLFAIKLISMQKLLKQEIDSLIALIHPYVVKLYSTFNDDEYEYLVMEYCQNGTLKDKGAIEYEHFVHYAKQLLEVLEYCHSQKIAHRDIKPENIYLDQYDHVKLGDFGFSNKFGKEESAHKKCGSLLFCAPEIITSSEFDPFKADIWALGITFFYLVTGKYPFFETNADRLKNMIVYGQIDVANYNINSQISFLIMKMTSKNPMFRPSPRQLLKLDLFKPIVPGQMLKSTSVGVIRSKIRRKSGLHLTFHLTHSNDYLGEEKDIDNIQKSNVQIKFGKIHSFHSYNAKTGPYKHSVKF